MGPCFRREDERVRMKLPVIARSDLSAAAQRAKADATKQSTLSFLPLYGLLRGACHRARIRATRWLAMTRKVSCARTEAQARVNPPCISAEFIRGLDRQRAWKRQIDREILRHPRRPGGEDGAVRGEEHRLLDAGGDKGDGLAAFAPDPQHLQIHLFARQGVERAERLLHQVPLPD